LIIFTITADPRLARDGSEAKEMGTVFLGSAAQTNSKRDLS